VPLAFDIYKAGQKWTEDLGRGLAAGNMAALIAQEPGYGPAAPVPVYQHEAEFTALLDIYKDWAPSRVLEVGTYHGGTLYHWLQNATEGATVVSVDRYSEGVDNRHLYPEWRPESVTLHAVSGDSHDPAIVSHVATYGPYDWVFIDAGHYYDEVRQDWELYGPMCAPGGVVCFHDILPPSANHPEIEVSRLWREIQAEYTTEEIIFDAAADWGGIGIVYA
jgi:predicted O-methyltransferase YrrM